MDTDDPQVCNGGVQRKERTMATFRVVVHHEGGSTALTQSFEDLATTIEAYARDAKFLTLTQTPAKEGVPMATIIPMNRILWIEIHHAQ